jgi:hypothetical protein
MLTKQELPWGIPGPIAWTLSFSMVKLTAHREPQGIFTIAWRYQRWNTVACGHADWARIALGNTWPYSKHSRFQYGQADCTPGASWHLHNCLEISTVEYNGSRHADWARITLGNTFPSMNSQFSVHVKGWMQERWHIAVWLCWLSKNCPGEYLAPAMNSQFQYGQADCTLDA